MAIVLLPLFCLLGGLYYAWHRLFSYQGLPLSLAFAGANGTFFSRGRATLKSVFALDSLIWDGHINHSQMGRPYILPDIFTGHLVILPSNQFQWLMEQPENALSQRESNNVFLIAADHTFLSCVGADNSEWSFVVALIKDITNDLNNQTNAVLDEIKVSLNDIWGDDPQSWKEINPLTTMMEASSRITNRAYVGLPLCRNSAYISSSINFARYILFEALFAQLVPQLIRPIFSPLVSAYDWLQFTCLASHARPIISERTKRLVLNDEERKGNDPDEQTDLLQRLIREALRRGQDPCCGDSQTIKLLALLNWAAVQTQGVTLENVLIDIAHLPDSVEIQRQMREEVIAASKVEPPARWSRAAMGKLPTMDSVLSESIRHWGFSRGMIKVVVAKEGVTLPSGEHIPCGAKIGVTSYGPHHDNDAYPGDPFTFDPFRFVKENTNAEKLDALHFPSTSEKYLAFSHGKHACPGRFYANHLLKLIMAQIVLRYDIKPEITPRPRNAWISYVPLPPARYKLKIRRRQAVEQV